MSALQMAVLAIVTLILGLFVVRPVLSRAPQSLPAPPPALPPGETAGEDAADGSIPALSGEIDPVDGMESMDLPDFGTAPDFGNLPDLGGLGGATDDPVDRLRSMIGDRQEETVEILRSWLEEKEEEA